MARPILLTVADRREPAFRRLFAEAVARALAGAPAARLTELLAAGRTDEAFRLAERAWVDAAARWRTEVAREIRGALEAGAAAIAQRAPDLVGRFDVTNPLAVAWVAERSARLVTAITEETRAAIRAILLRAFTQPLAPRDAARLIRGVVGLTARQAAAVARFRETLQGLQTKPAGTAIETNLRRLSNRGLDDARVADLTDRYAARLVRQRALTIARTEVLAALNEGQRHAWVQAADAEQVDDQVLERRWIVTDDERLCPICEPLDGARAPIGGRFEEPGGAGPPIHPNCRCTEGLVLARPTAAVA